MTKTQYIIDNNIATQDPDNINNIIFNVPIIISKEAVNLGAFELVASDNGWRSTTDTIDESGNMITVDNPLNLYNGCIKIIQDICKGKLLKVLLEDGARKGRQAAQEAFNQLGL
tara:strand:- start:4008 stop:4349 length:342 start_codon:yes stop_codon:yes gene_type:complete